MSCPTRLARRRPFHIPIASLESTSPDEALIFTPDGLGHDAYVEVVLSGPIDPASGMILNIRDVDETLARALEPFERGAPRPATTAALAERLFELLRPQFGAVSLEKLRLFENTDTWVDVWP